MVNLDQIPHDSLCALDRLGKGESIIIDDLSMEAYFSFLHLEKIGLIERRLPDPNFLYQTPKALWDKELYKLSNDGVTAYKLLQDRRQQMSDQRAEEEAAKAAQEAQRIEDSKKQRRHDFAVAAFGGVVTLFAEHFPEIVDLIKRLFEFIALHL